MSNTQYGKFGATKASLKQPEEGADPVTVDGVYQELISLRKHTRVQGDRIKHLEV